MPLAIAEILAFPPVAIQDVEPEPHTLDRDQHTDEPFTGRDTWRGKRTLEHYRRILKNYQGKVYILYSFIAVLSN